MKFDNLLLTLLASSTLVLTGCGGGSSSGGSSSGDLPDTNNTPVDPTPGDSTGDSGSNDGDNGGTDDSNDDAVLDPQVSDQSWSAGDDEMIDMIWPYADIESEAPLYLLKHTSSGAKIMKGKPATSTESAEDFAEVLSFTGNTVGAIEAYRFIDANGQPDRLIYTCDNSSGTSSINIYKESDFGATPASLPLYNYYPLGAANVRWDISNCDSLSIGAATVSTSGFSVTLIVGGIGGEQITTANFYQVAKAEIAFNINAGGSITTGTYAGLPTRINKYDANNNDIQAVHALDGNSAIVAFTAPANSQNRVHLTRDAGSDINLVISGENKFDGTTSLWDVKDIHVWKKSATDARVYMTSPAGGSFLISYNPTNLTKNGDHTFTSGDIQHCGDVITGFRSPATSGTLWCQDSTDAAEILEFTAPDMPAL